MTYRIIPAIVLAAGVATGLALPAAAAQDSSRTSPAEMEQWDAEMQAPYFGDGPTVTFLPRLPREPGMETYDRLALYEQERLRQECMTAPNSQINPADGAMARDEAFSQLCMRIQAEPER